MSAYKRILLFSALTAVAFFAFAKTSDAQGFRGRSRVVVVGGFYANPYYLYDPGFAYEGQWGYPMYPPPYRYGFGQPDSSVRIEVKPKEAEVFVDGYYAGIVDDYDGVFQRLRVTPGQHEIELYLDGYRTVRQKVYLPVNDTFKLKYTMERLAPGDQPEARPQPINPPMPPQAGGPPPMQPMGQGPGRGPAGRRMPPPQTQPQPPDNSRSVQAGSFGTLAIRVQPGDAEVSIDGDQWRGPDGRDQLMVDVAAGSHTVEIRKSGFRTYVTQVEVRRGETTPLNVSLRSQDQQQ